jgi:hypothetical protein
MKSVCASNSHVPVALFQLPFAKTSLRFSPTTRRSGLLSNRAWTAKEFVKCIEMRLLNTDFLKWELIALSSKDADKSFKVIHIDFANINKIQQIDLGYEDKVDASTWFGGPRSYVLVGCPHRDARIRAFITHPSINFSPDTFPENEAFLHPGQIRCILHVKYDVVLERYATSVPDAKIKYVSQSKESGYQSKEAIFAVVDFFKPHKCRHRWSFGAVAELWDQECFQYAIRQDNYLTLAECLVPLNRIAGKFIPGHFRPEEFDMPEQPWEIGLKPMANTGKWATPMVVMRLPGRVCLNPSNYAS